MRPGRRGGGAHSGDRQQVGMQRSVPVRLCQQQSLERILAPGEQGGRDIRGEGPDPVDARQVERRDEHAVAALAGREELHQQLGGSIGRIPRRRPSENS